MEITTKDAASCDGIHQRVILNINKLYWKLFPAEPLYPKLPVRPIDSNACLVVPN